MKKISFYFFVVFCVYSASAQNNLCVNALQQVSQDSLVQFVLKVTGRNSITLNGVEKKIKSRYMFHPDNIIAGDYIKATCQAYGFIAEDIPYSGTGRNIIMYKEGKVDAKQAYILCAHYDCVGSSTTDFQGADDNASGVAAMLEAARVLKELDFPYTLILAFWDEEESGALGSKAFAPDGPLGFWDVKGVINIDMIGYDGNNDSLGMIHTFPVGNSLMLATKLVDIKNKFALPLQSVIKNPGDASTDHQSFWVKGATAVGLTEDYDNDFSPSWHLLSDSIENMDIPYFTQMSKWAIASICEIAQTGSIVGVNETAAKLLLDMYPNPTNDKLFVGWNANLGNATLIVYDLMGKIMLTQSVSGTQTILDLTNLPSGFYMVEIASSSFVTKQQFIKTD